MTRTRGRMVEVDSLAQFDELVAAGARSMRGWRLQDLDLTGREAKLSGLDAAGALFLGCALPPALESALRASGALVFPRLPDVPFDPYRTLLYSADELYAGVADGYSTTPDARIYAWSRGVGGPGRAAADLTAALAMTLHDHAVGEALAEVLAGVGRVVGVMGGHAMHRRTPSYADAVRLGHTLAGTGLVVATGGGPGAMEAANLGAAARSLSADRLGELVAQLARVPDFRPSVTRWACAGLAVRDELESVGFSLAIPTWFYGHEPPNVFATGIAKLFRNALREDVLLQVCTGGIVFLPGAAGTVQEIFQDGCENYYAEPGAHTPMVLVGRTYWTEELPAWPLLRSLAQRNGFERQVVLVDTVDEVPAALASAAAS